MGVGEWGTGASMVLVLVSNKDTHVEERFLQSGKTRWYTLPDLRESVSNPLPQYNVDLSHVVKSFARSPNIDIWWVGKSMVRVKPYAFF